MPPGKFAPNGDTDYGTNTILDYFILFILLFFILRHSRVVPNSRRVLLTAIDGETVWPSACAVMPSATPRTSPETVPAQDTHWHEVVSPLHPHRLCSHPSSGNSSSLQATSIRFLAQLGERESCQRWYIRNTIQAAAICVLFLDDFIFSPQTDLNFYNIILSSRSNNICCTKRKVNSFALSSLRLSIYIFL